MKHLLTFLIALVGYGQGEAVIPPRHVSIERPPALQRPAMERVSPMRRPALDPPLRRTLDMGPKYRACDRYDEIFLAAAQRWMPWGLKEEGAKWLKAQAFTESSCRPRVCSSAGACGVMQHLEGTAKDMGIVDRFDAVQSIEGGARYVQWLYGQWKAHGRTWLQRIRLALDAYNRGLGNTLGAQRKFGCVMWTCFRLYAPTETKHYVDVISLRAGHPVL